MIIKEFQKSTASTNVSKSSDAPFYLFGYAVDAKNPANPSQLVSCQLLVNADEHVRFVVRYKSVDRYNELLVKNYLDLSESTLILMIESILKKFHREENLKWSSSWLGGSSAGWWTAVRRSFVDGKIKNETNYVGLDYVFDVIDDAFSEYLQLRRKQS